MVNCVLNQADWNELYSQADYAKLVKKDASLEPATRDRISNSLVEYLIAFNQPDATIIGCAKKKPALLQIPRNKYLLSVVHLAVMKNRLTLVPALIEAGANPLQLDAYGWLPLHHAALVSKEMYALIVARTKVKTDPQIPLQLTSSDLRQYVGLEQFQFSLGGVKIELEPGMISGFIPDKHLALFGMTEYTDCPRLTGKEIKVLWQPASEVEVSLEAKNLQLAFEKPPKVLLKKSEINGQWGLFAHEKLECGRVLFSYSGEVVDLPPPQGLFDLLQNKKGWPRYLANGADAQRVGNVSRFINDGFPNCMVFGFPGFKGKTWSFVRVINDSIKKGEEFFWDYGQGEARLKWNSCYTLANRLQMREFVKTHTVSAVEENARKFSFRLNPTMQKTNANRLKDFQADSVLAKLHYCFYTPVAILDLWCEGIITAEEWHQSMVEHEKRMPHLIPEHLYYAYFIYFFLLFLSNLERQLKEQPVHKEKIISFIRTLEGKLTSFEISEVLYSINSWLEAGRLPWQDFQARLSKAIVHQEDRDITKLEICKIYRQKVQGHL